MTDQWDRFIDWSLVLPPNRPSPLALAMIRRRIQHIDRDRPIGVLGSTPEFLDLVAQLGFESVVAFEKFPAFKAILDTDRLTPPTEQVVVGDWVDTLNASWCLAVLLSDLTLGNVPYREHWRFLTGIASSLAPDGIFIDRVLTNTGTYASLDLLDAKYQWQPLNLQTVNDFSSEYLFLSELLMNRDTVDSSLFYDVLADRFVDERLRKFLTRSELITPRNCTWHYGKPWSEVGAEYCSHLEVVDIWEEPRASVYEGSARTLVTRAK